MTSTKPEPRPSLWTKHGWTHYEHPVPPEGKVWVGPGAAEGAMLWALSPGSDGQLRWEPLIDSQAKAFDVLELTAEQMRQRLAAVSGAVVVVYWATPAPAPDPAAAAKDSRYVVWPSTVRGTEKCARCESLVASGSQCGQLAEPPAGMALCSESKATNAGVWVRLTNQQFGQYAHTWTQVQTWDTTWFAPAQELYDNIARTKMLIGYPNCDGVAILYWKMAWGNESAPTRTGSISASPTGL